MVAPLTTEGASWRRTTYLGIIVKEARESTLHYDGQKQDSVFHHENLTEVFIRSWCLHIERSPMLIRLMAPIRRRSGQRVTRITWAPGLGRCVVALV